MALIEYQKLIEQLVGMKFRLLGNKNYEVNKTKKNNERRTKK